MIAFVQPFGLQAPGGGPRILRSVLSEAPFRYLSICTAPRYREEWTSPNEIHLALRPYLGRIERSRLGRYLAPLDVLVGSQFKARLERVCREHEVTAIHAIPHGLEFWYAYEVAHELRVPYYLNVHDDMSYNLRGRSYVGRAMERLAYVWTRAAGCIVISEAMGEEYNRRYGVRPYDVVTDGLETIAPAPRPLSPNDLRVYLMGSVHRSYQANFASLFAALDMLQAQHPAWQVSFTIRGGFPFDVDTRGIQTNLLPWGSEDDVGRDMEEADLLYLPLPFDERHGAFVRYSLSTKMVNYLGSGLPILYHGPAEAAAGRLLEQHCAAIHVPTLDPGEIADQIVKARAASGDLVEHALVLARTHFPISEQRRKLWEVLCRDISEAGLAV